ncbi:hypothetical protein SDC9_155610 [bioreactor metagenome]|uniref:Uncharacterized protein n=1 Tax=bioreactor metagenome TaxID=1076179 RepID=A0A645F1Y2_9ZZZZ
MQKSQEAATEAETQRLRNFRLVLQRRIVELELFQRFAQRIVLVRFDRVQTRKDLRFDFLEAGQRLGGLAVHRGNGVADLGRLQLLDAGNDEAHLAGTQFAALHRFRREDTDLFAKLLRLGGHEIQLVLRTHHAIDNPYQHDDADVVIEP